MSEELENIGYKIELNDFQGPLGLLLQLIEKNKLEITNISLSEVTNQYLAHLKQLEDKNPEEMADFLVIAARLLHIKSKAILPMITEDEEEIDLEKQLKIYKEFLDASKKIKNMIGKKNFSYFRPRVVAKAEIKFSPPEKLKAKDLKESFVKLIDRAKRFVIDLPKKVIERTVSIQEKINHIQTKIFSADRLNFSSLLDNKKSKVEKIVSFLAMLELVKQRVIRVEQKELFEEISLFKHND